MKNKSPQSLSERQRRGAVETGILTALRTLSPLFDTLSQLRFPTVFVDKISASMLKIKENICESEYKFPPFELEIQNVGGIRRISADLKKSEFVQALIANRFKIKDAALSVGYSEQKASAAGAVLIRDEVVQSLIAQVMEDERHKTIADLEELLTTATSILRDPKLKPKDKLSAITTLAGLMGVRGKSVNVNIASLNGSKGMSGGAVPVSESITETVVRIIDTTASEDKLLEDFHE